jgi:hypothetical protein
MDPKGSLLHSQEPATFLYPEPDQSGPCTPIQLLEDPFQYYIPIYTIFSTLLLPHTS